MTTNNRRVMTIAYGPQGTRETLRIMAGLTREALNDANFRLFASIFRSTEQTVAVITTLYRYTPEQVETLFAPEFNLKHFVANGYFIGDCDDISMLLGAIFTYHQIPARFVAMRTRRYDPDYYHVVIETFEQNRWKRYDPTVPPALVQLDYGQMYEYI